MSLTIDPVLDGLTAELNATRVELMKARLRLMDAEREFKREKLLCEAEAINALGENIGKNERTREVNVGTYMESIDAFRVARTNHEEARKRVISIETDLEILLDQRRAYEGTLRMRALDAGMAELIR